MHRAFVASLLVASTAFAQSADEKLNAFAEQVRAERKRLGLDKKNQRFPTPEVKFVGAAAGDGVTGVVCPEQSLVVSLDGVPPKSLVLARSDDLQVSNESWAGNRWTGTLTARKGAAPQAFSLDMVLATSGKQLSTGRFVLGCAHSLTFQVDGATMTAKVELKELQQQVQGTWKTGAKTLGQRTYQLSVRERGIALEGIPDEADQQRMAQSMEAMMSSKEMRAIEARHTAVMNNIEACTKLAEKSGPCAAPFAAQNEKISAERAALQLQAQKASAPPYGCMRLEATIDGKGEAQTCSGHASQDRVPLTWSWTSPEKPRSPSF